MGHGENRPLREVAGRNLESIWVVNSDAKHFVTTVYDNRVTPVRRGHVDRGDRQVSRGWTCGSGGYLSFCDFSFCRCREPSGSGGHSPP